MTYKDRFASISTWSILSPAPLNQYAVSLLAVAVAVMMGLTIGAEKWLYSLAALVIALTLLYPVQVAFGLFALLVPFDSIAALGQTDRGRTLTWFVGAAAAIVLLGAGLITRRLKSPPSAGIWWILFTFWSAVTALWALNPQTSLQRLPTALALLGLYIASGCFRYRKSELQAIVFLSILGGCVAAIWAAYLFYHGEYLDATSMRASLLWGTREANPNDLGMSLLLPISLGFGCFLSSRRWLGKAIMLAAIAVTTLGLLVTMSRGAFVALVVVLFVYLHRRRARLQIIVPLLALAILLSIMPSAFFNRFQEATESGGAGRLDIWKVGLRSFGHYALAGAGLENFPLAYYKFAGEATHFRGLYRDPHNIYLGIAVETGLIGLLLFASAVTSQLRTALRFKNHPSAYNLLLATEAAAWGILAFGLFGNNLWQKPFWLSWMLLSAAVSASEEPSEANRKSFSWQ